jgi:hypothetical protein
MVNRDGEIERKRKTEIESERHQENEDSGEKGKLRSEREGEVQREFSHVVWVPRSAPFFGGTGD